MCPRGPQMGVDYEKYGDELKCVLVERTYAKLRLLTNQIQCRNCRKTYDLALTVYECEFRETVF